MSGAVHRMASVFSDFRRACFVVGTRPTAMLLACWYRWATWSGRCWHQSGLLVVHECRQQLGVAQHWRECHPTASLRSPGNVPQDSCCSSRPTLLFSANKRCNSINGKLWHWGGVLSAVRLEIICIKFTSSFQVKRVWVKSFRLTNRSHSRTTHDMRCAC